MKGNKDSVSLLSPWSHYLNENLGIYISSIDTGSICQLLGYHCAPSAFHVQRNTQYNMHAYKILSLMLRKT